MQQLVIIFSYNNGQIVIVLFDWVFHVYHKKLIIYQDYSDRAIDYNIIIKCYKYGRLDSNKRKSGVPGVAQHTHSLRL